MRLLMSGLIDSSVSNSTFRPSSAASSRSRRTTVRRLLAPRMSPGDRCRCRPVLRRGRGNRRSQLFGCRGSGQNAESRSDPRWVSLPVLPQTCCVTASHKNNGITGVRAQRRVLRRRGRPVASPPVALLWPSWPRYRAWSEGNCGRSFPMAAATAGRHLNALSRTRTDHSRGGGMFPLAEMPAAPGSARARESGGRCPRSLAFPAGGGTFKWSHRAG